MKNRIPPSADEIVRLLKFYRSMGMEYIEKTETVEQLLELLEAHGSAKTVGNKNCGWAKSPTFPRRKAVKGMERPFHLKKDKEKLHVLTETFCSSCPLHHEAEANVPGTGRRDAKLLVAGEFPASEDMKAGLPFQGEAGDMLTRMLRAIGIERNGVWLTLAQKCRIPRKGARQNEISHLYGKVHACCKRIFIQEIMEIEPAFILCLGLLPAQFILSEMATAGSVTTFTDFTISSLRGRVITIEERGIQMIVTHSPVSILQQPRHRIKELKKEAWHDLQLLEKIYSFR